MAKITVALFIFTAFLSLSIFVNAQVVDDSLVIDSNIGEYKYIKPPGSPYFSDEQRIMFERVGFAGYNLSKPAAAVIVIEAKKIAYPEFFIEKLKNQVNSPHKLTTYTYKGSNLYGLYESLRLWQSGKYLIMMMGPGIENLEKQADKLPEQILDAYLEKYPVDYFNCPKLVYTQEMPPDGYNYVPDYDENGCESGRHVEPISQTTPIIQPTPQPIATAIPEPITTYVPVPVSSIVPISEGVAKREIKRNNCIDSDNGEDVYIKGKVSGYQDESYTNYWTRIDSCNTQLSENGFTGDSYRGEGVMEYFCTGDGVIVASYIKCSEGYVCQDGSCTGIDETGLRCADPDQGDYFTRGMTCGYPRYPAVGPMNCVVDKCEGNKIIEYGLVGSDCVVGSNPSTCPNGCSDGACISVNTQETSTKETSTGITGKVVDKTVGEENIERAASAALKLEGVRITLSEAQRLTDSIAVYYRNTGEAEKSTRWSEISSMFEAAVGMADNIIQYLKSTRDTEGARTKLADLRIHIKDISEKILSD